MTSGPPSSPIRSFDDVLANRDLRVIVVSGSFQASMLENSEAGSAKYRVYQTQIKDDMNAWYPTTKDALEAVASQPQNLLYFHDSAAKGNQGLVALRMDDSTKTRSGMDDLSACCCLNQNFSKPSSV